jgi:hypothetical protein
MMAINEVMFAPAKAMMIPHSSVRGLPFSIIRYAMHASEAMLHKMDRSFIVIFFSWGGDLPTYFFAA